MDQDSAINDPFVSEGGQSSFDIWSYLNAAKKFWWIIALGLLGGLGVGLVLVQLSEPEFVSTAEIKVERRAASSSISLSGGPMAFEGATTTEDLKTIEKSFASPALMRRVAEKLKELGRDDLFLDGTPIQELNNDTIAGYLMAGCSVSLIQDTRLIQISFRSQNPATAQVVADLIVQEGIQNETDQRIAASASNIKYLREEVQKFEDNLRASEEKLNTYTRTLGNVSIDSDLNLVANQLREFNSRATGVKAERLRLESEYAQVEARVGNVEKLMEIDTIQRLPSIVSLGAQIAESQGRIEKLALRYRDSSPFMMQARSELAALKDSLNQEILNAPKMVESALAAAKKAEEAILREQDLQEEKVIQVRDLAVPANVLQRQIELERQGYEESLKRLTEELSQARSQPVLLQVVNPAGGAIPSGSKPIRLLGAALFAGAIFGFGIVFLITQLDTSIKSPEEAERFLGIPVLTAVPQYEGENDDKQAGSVYSGFFDRCPALSDRYSATAEAFRALRAALRSRYEDESGHTILFSASEEGEGISFCAANLAVVLAQAGQRTLLVDANLRHPTVEKLVFTSCGRTGLTEYLHGEAGIANILHASPVPLLDVVTAGRHCPFPAESLSKERFARFLKNCAPIYDKIVVDSAPISKFSDSLGFARLIPFVCLVIASGKTPKSTVKRSVELLTQSGARPTGTILNATPVVFHKKTKTQKEDELDGFTGALSAPAIICPSCGKSYRTFTSFLASTSGPVDTPDDEYDDGRIFRRCSCGRAIGAKKSELRDLSQDGETRRKVFGEILERLEAAGIEPEEARQKLLLSVKIWRNEIPDDAAGGSSPASAERAKIYNDLLEQLISLGQTRDEAKALLDEAIEAWRSAP